MIEGDKSSRNGKQKSWKKTNQKKEKKKESDREGKKKESDVTNSWFLSNEIRQNSLAIKARRREIPESDFSL